MAQNQYILFHCYAKPTDYKPLSARDSQSIINLAIADGAINYSYNHQLKNFFAAKDAKIAKKSFFMFLTFAIFASFAAKY